MILLNSEKQGREGGREEEEEETSLGVIMTNTPQI
jgi:hypothetical protein